MSGSPERPAREEAPPPRRADARVGYLPAIALGTLLNGAVTAVAALGAWEDVGGSGLALLISPVLSGLLIRKALREVDRPAFAWGEASALCVFLNCAFAAAWLVVALTRITA